jgi:hypothetical protein
MSSVALLLQPECNCFTSYNTRKGLCSLFPCAIVLRSPPSSQLSTCNGQRSSQLFCFHYTHVTCMYLTVSVNINCPLEAQYKPKHLSEIRRHEQSGQVIHSDVPNWMFTAVHPVLPRSSVPATYLGPRSQRRGRDESDR